MKKAKATGSLTKLMIRAQRIEETEYRIYAKLAGSIKNDANSAVLSRIAEDELAHVKFWKRHTGKDVKPYVWKLFSFFWVARLLGLTFGIKLLEKGEAQAQQVYGQLISEIPEVDQLVNDEEEHEQILIGMIEEEGLKYIGSIVLGLNDALVELTGALAGLTFAFRNTRLIALAGLITGTAASFSMAASEYLSKKTGGEGGHPIKSSVYTGLAYVVTVVLLILPYLLISHYLICLLVTIATAVLIIFFFNYYIAVAQDLSFRRRFFEMATISLGVSALSFGIGYVIRIFLGVEI